MGCVNSYYRVNRERRTAKLISNKIDEYLEKCRSELEKMNSFLVLGASGSGRGTFLQNLRHLYSYGFNDQDLSDYKWQIFCHLRNSMFMLVTEMKQKNIPFANEESLVHEQKLEVSFKMSINDLEDIKDLWVHVKALWADNGVQESLRRCFEIQSNDSLWTSRMDELWTSRYLFDDIERICEANYVPKVSDILYLKTFVCGIFEFYCSYRNVDWKFIDPRIRRPEPHRWLHHFQSVTGVFYLVNLSEYDHWFTTKDGPINKLQHTLAEYETFCRNPAFSHLPKVLILNKQDIFYEKLKTRPLTVCFSEYNGGGNPFEEATEYVKKQFEDKNPQAYIHFTSAIETESVRRAFYWITESILQFQQSSC